MPGKKGDPGRDGIPGPMVSEFWMCIKKKVYILCNKIRQNTREDFDLVLFRYLDDTCVWNKEVSEMKRKCTKFWEYFTVNYYVC